MFQLGENLFYRIEVRAVGWQKVPRRPGGVDGFANSRDFMGAEIVHHNDFARRQGRHQNLLDIGEELCAIDGTVKDTRRGDAIVTQGGHECRRLPMTEGRVSEQPLAPFATPVAGRHVGRSPGLVDKHKLFRIKAFLHLAPGETGGLNIGPFLFRGVQSFFYRSISDAAKSVRRRTVRL